MTPKIGQIWHSIYSYSYVVTIVNIVNDEIFYIDDDNTENNDSLEEFLHYFVYDKDIKHIEEKIQKIRECL